MIAESLKKLSQEEVITLRKLGLSHKEIAELGANDNPFKDVGFSEKHDVVDVINDQKMFYEDL